MLCGWGVKEGVAREWVAGKTLRFPSYQRPYVSALVMCSSHNRALYKCTITVTLLSVSLIVYL